MATYNNVRVLVGFPGLLERTIVQFVEKVPSQKVCSLCGTVPKRLNIASCSHPFCNICLDLIVQQSHVCPLDLFVLKPADTVQKDNGDNDIGSIFCPNNIHGCAFTGTATETLSRHLSECCHHQVQCRKCLAMTSHSNILEHVTTCQRLAPECRSDTVAVDLRKPSQNVTQPAADSQETTDECLPAKLFSAESCDSAMSKLLKIQDAINSLQSLVQDRIPSVIQLNTAIRSATGKTTEEQTCVVNDPRVVGCKDFLDRKVDKKLPECVTVTCRDVIPAEVCDILGKMDLLERKLSLIQMRTCKTKAFWHVDRYASFKNEVDPELQLASRFSEPLIVAGYTVKLQVDIDKGDPSSAWLGMYAIFMKGPADEFLDWPVKKPILFTLVHPETGKKNVKRHLIPGARKDLITCFSRPGSAGANEGCGYDRVIQIETMEKEGFILNDAFTIALSVRQTMPMRFID
ncbi:uncharacterized protein LOC135399991 [Ornithodoros turicata]|uniref:uncharacterized protein LOC135399991 n=1 Tax=Ornithodoros turicata TaxID=34597 RepID=UPI00313A377B